MAQSDSNNSSGRGATRSALIIVGVLSLLGLAYAIARVDILRARLVTQATNLRVLQENHDSLRGQVSSLDTGVQNSSKQVIELQTELGNLSSNFGELRDQAEQARRLSARSEALYLLRLANNQLQLAHDLTGAIDTLSAAERLLLNTHDTLLEGVLHQVQGYLQQLRARPDIDTGLIQQQLATAEQQVSSLSLAGIDLQRHSLPAVPADSGFARACAMLKRAMSSLFSIRKTGEQTVVVLTSDEQALRRRHLQLLLLNARLSLLTRDQKGYATALKNASSWLDQVFATDDPAVAKLRQQLQQLTGYEIAPATPDLSPSIQTLSRSISSAAGGAETP